MQIRVHTDHSSWIPLIFGIASETIFWVLDETRAISDAVVKLHGVMVGFVVCQYTRGTPDVSHPHRHARSVRGQCRYHAHCPKQTVPEDGSSRPSTRWIDGRSDAPAPMLVRPPWQAQHASARLGPRRVRPVLERHGLGDIHFVKSLIAFPQRKSNIQIVVINGFDLD
jgi:hypothetical protein